MPEPEMAGYCRLMVKVHPCKPEQEQEGGDASSKDDNEATATVEAVDGFLLDQWFVDHGLVRARSKVRAKRLTRRTVQVAPLGSWRVWPTLGDGRPMGMGTRTMLEPMERWRRRGGLRVLLTVRVSNGLIGFWNLGGMCGVQRCRVNAVR